MHEFKINNKIHGSFPSTWNELTREQLLYVAGLFSHNFSRKQILVMSLRHFMDLPWKTFKTISPEALAELCEMVSFIHQRSTLTKQLIPQIKVYRRNSGNFVLHGPTSGLQNVTFEQFFWHADDCYNRIQSEKGDRYLNRLVASLYLFDEKEFDSGRIDEIEHLVRFVATDLKFSCYLFFGGCRNFLAYKFPKVFSGKGGSGKPDDLAPIRLLSSVNDFDITKNPQIKKTNIYEALTNMEEMIAHNERMKAEMKRKK